MVQNTSSAVMQQRVEPHNSLDDFPTPPWATRAACEWVAGQMAADPDLSFLSDMVVREPCANRGHMVRPLIEFFGDVDALDVHDYGVGFRVEDYLFGHDPEDVDWTFMNPPFRLAAQFIARALRSSQHGVVVFVRSAFAESVGRYLDLFSKTPPTAILQFSERVVLYKGRLVDPDVKLRVWSKKEGKFVWRLPSSATAYCWMIWDLNATISGTSYHWIAPCRQRLTRLGDYDVC